MSSLLVDVAENLFFALQFLGIAAMMFVIAYLSERAIKKRSGDHERVLATRKIAAIGVFSAIAVVLHIIRIPIPFIAPVFYDMDISELPALIGGFAYGPVAGVLIVFVKVLLKLMIQGTQTAFVGDLANFVVGCSLILPATIIYACGKTRKSAYIACIVGTLTMTVFATVFNAVYLIPVFSELFFGGDLDRILSMGTSFIPDGFSSVWALALIAVAPFNLLKGTLVSVVTLLVYKKIRPLLK